MISLLEYGYISILHYDIIILCILLFDLSHLLPFTVVNVGYQSTLPTTCPGVTMFPHFPMKYSEEYKNNGRITCDQCDFYICTESELKKHSDNVHTDKISGLPEKR